MTHTPESLAAIEAWKTLRAEVASYNDRLTSYNAAVTAVKASLDTKTVATISAELKRLEAQKLRQQKETVSAILAFRQAQVVKAEAEVEKAKSREALNKYNETIVDRYHKTVNALLGIRDWPARSSEAFKGVVSAITDNGDGTYTIEDDNIGTGGWDLPPTCTAPAGRWGPNVSCAGPTPASYTVVIDLVPHGQLQNEKQAVKAVIQSSSTSGTTGTLIVTDTNLKNALTSGRIAAISDLVGRDYFIIGTDSFLWYTERWINWPNEGEKWRGQVDSSTSTFTTHGLSLTDLTNRFTGANQRWRHGRWGMTTGTEGYECIVEGDDGYWHRLQIISNDRNTLYFADDGVTDEWNPTGHYVIVAAGSVAEPNRTAGYPFLSYGGILDQFWTHEPDDSRNTVGKPALQFQWLARGDDGECDDEFVAAFDIDVRSEISDDCQPPDHFFAPDLYKTIRSWQITAEGFAPSFVEPDRDYSGAKSIDDFTVARWWHFADVNAGTTSSSNFIDSAGQIMEVGSVAFPQPTPLEAAPTEMPVVWAAYDSNDVLQTWGSGTLSHGVTGGTDGFTLSSGELTNACQNCTIYYSYGWSRFWERRVKYMYGRSLFIPDYDAGNPPLDPGVGIVDPPRQLEDSSCFGVGMFVHHPPDTRYCETDSLMNVIANDGVEFIDGEYVRYVGDNWSDPAIGFGTPIASVGASDETVALLPYYDHGNVGKHKPSNRSLINRSKLGRATSGSDRHLTDTTKDWYGWNWFTNSVMRTESGTVTSGTVDTLVDSSKVSSCFWEGSRFDNFPGGGSYATFILKLYKNHGESNETIYKTPILSGDASTGTLTIMEIPGGIAPAAGDYYEIQEVYELNRWQGRILRVWYMDPDSTNGVEIHRDLLITHSDNDSIWFEAIAGTEGFTIAAGYRYKIIEWPVGAVLTKIPGSADERGSHLQWSEPWFHSTADNHGTAWKKNLFANKPTIVKGYGLAQQNDIVSPELINELYRGIDALRWVQVGINWSSRADLVTAQNNEWIANGHGNAFEDPDHPGDLFFGMKEEADAVWDDINAEVAAGDIQFERDGIAPYAEAILTGPAGDADAGLGRLFAYGYASGIPNILASSIDFYNFADVRSIATDTCDEVDFNDQGDAVLFQQWNKWDSQAASSNATRISAQLGSNDKPAWPPNPPCMGGSEPDGGNGLIYHGYTVTAGKAILKYDSVDGSGIQLASTVPVE